MKSNIFTTEDHIAANNEGWDIFSCTGSESGEWQIQMIDDLQSILPEIILINILQSDEDAWKIVANGKKPHHSKAIAFLKQYNIIEYNNVMKFKNYEIEN